MYPEIIICLYNTDRVVFFIFKSPGGMYHSFLRGYHPTGSHSLIGHPIIPHALLPLQAYEMLAPTINDDMEQTTKTSLQLKAREHAASLALLHARNSF